MYMIVQSLSSHCCSPLTEIAQHHLPVSTIPRCGGGGVSIELPQSTASIDEKCVATVTTVLIVTYIVKYHIAGMFSRGEYSSVLLN